MEDRIKLFSIKKNITVKQAMRKISENGEKVLFVVDEKERLFGVLSDGDIRKWILSEGDLAEKIETVCNKNPVTVGEDYQIDDVKKLMLQLKIGCIPAVNDQKEIKDVLIWDTIFNGKRQKTKKNLELQVVIMAGGKGTRLDPFTTILPKPLIPIADKPIIEIIMDKFSEYGINKFFVSVNHKAKMVKSYFEDSNGNYSITYLEEDRPLGTAGSLKLLQDKISGSILVTNCDTIIDSDYGEFLKFHDDNGNDLTLVVSSRHYEIPFGVCDIENGGILKGMREKPEYHFLVNTGMYLLKSEMLDLIPQDQQFNITDLITKAQSAGKKIGVFPISENSWIDIGNWEEYRKAVQKLRAD